MKDILFITQEEFDEAQSLQSILIKRPSINFCSVKAKKLEGGESYLDIVVGTPYVGFETALELDIKNFIEKKELSKLKIELLIRSGTSSP